MSSNSDSEEETSSEYVSFVQKEYIGFQEFIDHIEKRRMVLDQQIILHSVISLQPRIISDIILGFDVNFWIAFRSKEDIQIAQSYDYLQHFSKSLYFPGVKMPINLYDASLPFVKLFFERLKLKPFLWSLCHTLPLYKSF